jgi:hypothetical protein
MPVVRHIRVVEWLKAKLFFKGRRIEFIHLQDWRRFHPGR